MRYIIRTSTHKTNPNKTWYEVRDTVKRNVKNQPRLVYKYKDVVTAEKQRDILERKCK